MNQIGKWGIVGTAVLVVLGGLLSFVWFPLVQKDAPNSLFAAWCSALGVIQRPLSGQENIPAGTVSDVVLTADLLAKPGAADVGHGATLSLRCTMCHGPTGISMADSPNLAGQYAVVIYKELRDFKSGVRTNAIMNPLMANLSDQDMRALAFYYASLPRPHTAVGASPAPAIVRQGSPMRNIAPCGACHGGFDRTQASPWLNGEPRAYIRAQLQAFATGQRTNDINGQMRAMAQNLTPEEIDQAADYFATGSP